MYAEVTAKQAKTGAFLRQYIITTKEKAKQR